MWLPDVKELYARIGALISGNIKDAFAVETIDQLADVPKVVLPPAR